MRLLRDFTGDGRAAVFDVLGRVHPGNGDGTFREGAGRGLLYMPLAVLIADINHDGLDDVIHQDMIQWFAELNRGDGTFAESDRGEVRRWSSSGLADVDGDGHPDLIQQRHKILFDGTYPIRVLRGNGDGTFENATGELAVDRYFGSFQPTDANRDGKLDLVAGTTVLLGDGRGGFGGFVEPLMAERPSGTAVTRGAIVAVIANGEAVTVMRMQPPMKRRAARN